MSVKPSIRNRTLITETALATAPSGRPHPFKNYFHLHKQAAQVGWQKLLRTPWVTFMTLIVIGIALALPAGLLVLLENVKMVSKNWDNSTQISLYLKMNLSSDDVQQLLSNLRSRPDIASAEYISPEMGLKQLQQQADLQTALANLKDNPLPGVILVQPAASLTTPAAVNGLLQKLKLFDNVDNAQLDMQWLERFQAIVMLSKRLVLVLGGLLAIGVLFIIGNTINLNLQKYRREIEIYKLVGASDRYVRRPFLYLGVYYGLMGGVLAWLLVAIIISSLHRPVQHLSSLYDSHFQLLSLDMHTTMTLLSTGILLGVIGAWLAVGRHLR